MKNLPFIFLFLFAACSKKEKEHPVIEPKETFLKSITIDGADGNFKVYNTGVQPAIKLNFSYPVKPDIAANNIQITDATGNIIPSSFMAADENKNITIRPTNPLQYLAAYSLKVSNNLGVEYYGTSQFTFITKIDSSDKFQRILDETLLDKVQKQTFKYFWDFGHPVSGLARERNTSGDVVTTGGSGFGIMGIIVAINRNFITRQEGLNRLQKIVSFLKNNAQTFHGAFSHWMNGATGAVVPFSAKDNGADLVETSFLLQ